MTKSKHVRPGPVEAFKAIEVKIKNNSFEAFDSALKHFKRMVNQEKILSLYKEKQSFIKPSMKRRKKIKEALEARFLASKKEKSEKAV